MTSEEIDALIRTWYEGLNVKHLGVDLADCLSYDLRQLLMRRAGHA